MFNPSYFLYFFIVPKSFSCIRYFLSGAHTDVERATPGVFLLKYCAFHALKSMCAVVNVVDGTTSKAEEFFLVQCPSFLLLTQ